jgi:hypothetical protein
VARAIDATLVQDEGFSQGADLQEPMSSVALFHSCSSERRPWRYISVQPHILMGKQRGLLPHAPRHAGSSSHPPAPGSALQPFTSLDCSFPSTAKAHRTSPGKQLSSLRGCAKYRAVPGYGKGKHLENPSQASPGRTTRRTPCPIGRCAQEIAEGMGPIHLWFMICRPCRFAGWFRLFPGGSR